MVAVGGAFLSPRELTALFLSVFKEDRRQPLREALPLIIGAVLLVAIDMGLSAVAYERFEPSSRAGDLFWANEIYGLRLLLALLYVGVVAVRTGRAVELFGIRPTDTRADLRWGMRAVLAGTVLYVIAGLAGVGVVLLDRGALPPPPAFVTENLTFQAMRDDWPGVLNVGVSGLVSAPLAEELIYRAILLPPLLMVFRPWLAILGNAAVFAVLHAGPYGLGWFVPAPLLGGAVMAFAFYARGLLPAILVHSFGNLLLAASGIVYANLPQYWPGLIE